jgi:hypothetical protein
MRGILEQVGDPAPWLHPQMSLIQNPPKFVDTLLYCSVSTFHPRHIPTYLRPSISAQASTAFLLLNSRLQNSFLSSFPLASLKSRQPSGRGNWRLEGRLGRCCMVKWTEYGVRKRQTLELESGAQRSQIHINHGLDFESILLGQPWMNSGIK